MTTPYYQDDLVTLYHGDCLDVLPTISEVDIVVTSPPYNLGVTTGGGRSSRQKWVSSHHDGKGIGYDTHDDAMPYVEYEAWQRTVLRACWDTLTDTGAIFYNHKPRVQGLQLWLPLALNPDLPLRQIIVWARAGGMNYAPTHYMSTHEWIMVFAKAGFQLKGRAASGLGDTWRINQQSNPDHPAPFPLALPASVVETTAPKLVLDPFAGSGTTLRAAKDAGVRAIGIEKSERYCEAAAKWLVQDTLFGAAS